LFLALAEMAMAGGVGAKVEAPKDIPLHAWAFGEDQGRYVVTLPEAAAKGLLDRAAKAGVPASRIGATGGRELTLDGCNPISLQRLKDAHEGWLPAYMAAAPAEAL
ncbi:AIR synthase-related protein, partial [Parvibaculum sp.]|uniref:AIR synthase-related protein n=1 Tax=Parvibaculum sp. TaxID=2024848 RepID=UPI00320FC210